jgi:flavin-binding protein dodecin
MMFAKMIEMSAESPESFEDAVKRGAQRACNTLENVQSIWVKNQHVTLENGSIQSYRVHLKITFQMRE